MHALDITFGRNPGFVMGSWIKPQTIIALISLLSFIVVYKTYNVSPRKEIKIKY